MSESWRVNFKLLEEEFATPNWNEETPTKEAIAELGGYKACKALIPPTAEAWCIYSRKEGGSWEEQGGTPGAAEELYELSYHDMEESDLYKT